jgi:outer membrane protein assembly factor BamA
MVAFLVLSGMIAHAETFVSDTTKAKSVSIIALPAVIRSPETMWGFGAASTVTFRMRKSSAFTRTSSFQVVGLYTTRKQEILGLDGNMFFPKDNYIFRLHSSYTYFPDKFWGLGNRTYSRQPVPFTYEQFYIFPQLLRRVYKHLYLGVSLEYQHIFRFKFDKNTFYDYPQVLGLQGGIVPGAGGLLTWDSRNNAFSPTKGDFLEFSFTDFQNELDIYNYLNYIIDFRKYIETTPGQVLAFQLYANLNKGTVPILSLAAMGGSTIMRGYYSGRFRDNNLAACQIEYRMHIWKRIGVVGFIGAGQVARQVSSFSINQFKCAGGGGIRFALKPDEKLNLRIDYGVAKYSQGFYLTVSEAF